MAVERATYGFGQCLTPGGEADSKHRLMDNFNSDPNTGLTMIQSAESVAQEAGG